LLGRVPHEPLLLAEFGKDAASQMGLEDVTMFRSVLDSVVFHPCDTWSTDKIAREAAELEGVTYIRTLRSKAPVLYDRDEVFPAGGSKVLRESQNDAYTVCAAGIVAKGIAEWIRSLFFPGRRQFMKLFAVIEELLPHELIMEGMQLFTEDVVPEYADLLES